MEVALLQLQQQQVDEVEETNPVEEDPEAAIDHRKK
jgi:hypothetical protein